MSQNAFGSVECRPLDSRGAALGSDRVSERKLIRFGTDFEIDASELELRHVGRTMKLERIPMQVLLILIEQKGQIVTRELIAEKVWGKDVFLDTDNGINCAIRKIRNVLKDDPQRPTFLETIPGRGYRFIAPIGEGEAGSNGSRASLSASAVEHNRAEDQFPSFLDKGSREKDPTSKGVAWGIVLGLAALLFCAIGLAAWQWWQRVHVADASRSLRSIAVLPLQNLSGDPAQDFFADGMTEELITELSRIQTLRVISHTSVMEYKGTRKHLPQIARELGVDGILEGSVIRENDQVRVTVQLLDGPNDRHIWSESYERPLHGVLNLQREVSEAVTQQIRIQLSPEQRARIGSAHPVNPEAYDAYLRGRYNLSTQYTMAQPLQQAKSYFEESIRKDPNFAEAYSGLADTYLYLALFRQAPHEAALQSAHGALHKAMQLDDSIGEVHDTLGTISWLHDWNWIEAEREFNLAIATAPSYSCAHEDRAEFLAFLGRRAEAMTELARISQLDLGPSASMTEAGVYYQLRDFPNLVEAGKRGIASNPNEWVEHHYLGTGYEGTGKLPEAIAEYQKAVELSNGDQDANASLAHAYAAIGKRAEAEKILRDLELKSKDSVSPYILATVYAGLGEKDKAIQFLEKAYDERSLEISSHLKVDLRIDNLRSDPRFQGLTRRVGLPQ